MKNISKLLVTLFLLSIAFSCITTSQAGTLPNKWWLLTKSKIQAVFRKTADGLESKVVIFVGRSNSEINMDEDIAIENARMDAAVLLSRTLSLKVTSVAQNSSNAIIQKLSESGMSEDQIQKSLKQIDNKFKEFSATVSSTQFSSFMEEGTHVELVKDKDHYQAWACYSMSDQILKETRDIQKKAFESLMAETEEYKAIMSSIQDIIANQMKENILSEMSIEK